MTANGIRVGVLGEDLETHLAGVTLVEVSPDGVTVIDGDIGGQAVRSLKLVTPGFPDLIVHMPLANAQAVGDSLGEKKVEVVRSMPSTLVHKKPE